MGVFTSLGDREQVGLADAFGIGAVHSCRTIQAGTINSNFEVVTSKGKFFVRINEGKAEFDVAWESRLVAALAERGLQTPAPLLAIDGRPYTRLADDGSIAKWVSVFPWRDGTHLSPDEVSVESAGKLGAALARLHLIGLELPAAWRRGSIYDHDHLVTRFQRVSASAGADPALTRPAQVLAEELATVSAASGIRRRATQGIIHGDLFRDNVLWLGGEVNALLDFEQASGGSLAYDLAVCINDWCWAQVPRIELAAALVRGYDAVRPLTPADRAALPIELRAAATRFTITRITDVYLARVDNPDKDFRAFLARVDAWRGPALGQLTAAL